MHYNARSFDTNNRYGDATLKMKLESRYSQQCSFSFWLSHMIQLNEEQKR